MSNLNEVIATVPSAGEAHIIVGLLESNGIGARSSADDMGGADPQLQLTQGVRVLVSAEDAEDARALIADATGS